MYRETWSIPDNCTGVIGSFFFPLNLGGRKKAGGGRGKGGQFHYLFKEKTILISFYVLSDYFHVQEKKGDFAVKPSGILTAKVKATMAMYNNS